jgi:hypothetical protein
LKLSLIIDRAVGSVAAIATPRSTLISTKIPKLSKNPVAKEVKLQATQAIVIRFLRFILLTFCPQKRPAMAKLTQKPAPDMSP